jgi:acyl-CoA hydrolase
LNSQDACLLEYLASSAALLAMFWAGTWLASASFARAALATPIEFDRFVCSRVSFFES